MNININMNINMVDPILRMGDHNPPPHIFVQQALNCLKSTDFSFARRGLRFLLVKCMLVLLGTQCLFTLLEQVTIVQYFSS